MAGNVQINNIYETPPSTPEQPQKESTTSTKNISEDFSKEIQVLEDLESFGPRMKVKRARAASRSILQQMKNIITSKSDYIGRSLGYGFLYSTEEDREFVSEIISSAITVIAEKHGIKSALASVNIHSQLVQSMRVPDWLQLYVKLATKLPDKSWQTILNFLNLGRSGKVIDAGILLTNNEIRAHKELVFGVINNTFDLQPVVPEELRGYGVSLQMVLIWAIRESRLHQGTDTQDNCIEFNLKLDGRPLAGREQVSIGIVPISSTNSCQSALSVYPLAIANCAEKREEVTSLIERVNDEKNTIKQEGLVVDGRKYTIKFKVTLDYKALLMLMVKKEDEEFVFGGRGVDIEFCVFCCAKRACVKHWHGSYNEVCAECLASKSNIGNWNGIRDDLLFLLEEDLSNICLCSLHAEMRNTEQLLGSLGLFAHRCGSLAECNQALAGFGPEISQGYDRIRVKLNQGQQTAVTKNNITVASFSGNTERKILENIDEIVSSSLPIIKVSKYYAEVADVGNNVVLKHVAFYHEIAKYITENILEKGIFVRDFGTYQEEVPLDNTKVLKQFLINEKTIWTSELEKLETDYILACEKHTAVPTPRSPKKKKRKKGTTTSSVTSSVKSKSKALAELASTLQIRLFHKVFREWSEIANTIRKREFEEDEDEDIDMFDVKCKLWGRCLRHLFGVSLGTGDYGHLTVDHGPMLFRIHRSFAKYSNQGFEASHKVQRALYSRSSNHDQGGVSESCAQIMTHWLSESMLFLRYQFTKAKECIDGANNGAFYFRGCGWKKKNVIWNEDDKAWIEAMLMLFNKMFGNNFLEYTYFKDKGTKISHSSDPRQIFIYNHTEWESKLHANGISEPGVSKDCVTEPSDTDDQPIPHDTEQPIPHDTEQPIPHDTEQPIPHGTEQPIPHDTEQPIPHDTEQHIPHDTEQPIPNDTEQPIPHDTEQPIPHDTKQPIPNDTEQHIPHDTKQPIPHDTEQPIPNDTEQHIPHDTEQPIPYHTVTERPITVDLTSDNGQVAVQSSLHAAYFTSAVTRRELSTLHIPIINSTAFFNSVTPVFGSFIETDPCTLSSRPPETIVNKAEKILQDTQASSVKIENLGTFSRSGVNLLIKFCNIANVKRELQQEERWLERSLDGLTRGEIGEIKTVLWDTQLQHTILQIDAKLIDVRSFTTLIGERYLDNFIIDVVIKNFIQEAGINNVVYLPSETFTWMISDDRNFIESQIQQAMGSIIITEVELILIPIHMNGAHWGLAVIDSSNRTLWFDDGLKIYPGREVFSSVVKILNALRNIHPKMKCIQTPFWSAQTSFKRFGMPSQCNVNGTGSGSCGVGVILSARDFIYKGPEAVGKFSWSFNEMKVIRKQLMKNIINWAKLN